MNAQQAQDEAMRVGLGIEWSAKELPTGYQINVCIEHGAEWVELIGPDGSMDFDTAHEALSYKITDATLAAIANAKDTQP